MTASIVLLLLQLVLSALLGWSCLCRLTKTDDNTHREVRWAFVFEAAMAGLVGGAPFLPLLMPLEFTWPPGETPAFLWVLLLVSVALVQLVTVRYWRGGVPEPFQKDLGVPAKIGGTWHLALATAAMSAFMLAVPRPAVADAPSAPQGTNEQPVHDIAMGEPVMCSYPGGCIAMIRPIFEKLLRAANAGGGSGCGPRT